MNRDPFEFEALPVSEPATPRAVTPGSASATLAVSVTAFFAGWVPILGALLGAAAAVLGYRGRRSYAPHRFHTVGLVLGSIAAVTSLLVTAAWMTGDAEDGAAASSVASSTPTSPAVEPAPDDTAALLEHYDLASPAPILAADLTRADAMGAWLQRASLVAFSDTYSQNLRDSGAELRDLAEAYPQEDSDVAADLSTAAEAMDSAQAALDDRDYSDARELFGNVGDALAGIADAIASDVAVVESQTGVRVGAGGALESATTTTEATIVRWVDGDTVETSAGRVRLIGVDTAELGSGCPAADQASSLASAIAPAGATIFLVNPSSVVDEDAYSRSLRYVVTATGADVGYSLLLNSLAIPRYDSRDGYQWHPHEKEYRGSGTVLADEAGCEWRDQQAGMALASGEDPAEGDRAALLLAVATAFDATGALHLQVDDARETHQRADDAARPAENSGTSTDSTSSGSSSDSSSGIGDDEYGTDADRPGYTGCRHYAPGGKTWKPMPCP